MNIDLVKLRVAGLGYSEGALTRELIDTKQDKDLFGNDAPYSGGAASAQGLFLCPAVVAPEVAIQLGDELTIGVEPIYAKSRSSKLSKTAKFPKISIFLNKGLISSERKS